MAVVQTTYGDRMAEATAGMVANTVNWDGVTYLLEDEAPVGFGLAVGAGTGDKQCSLGGALTTFLGVTVKDITLIAGATRTSADTYVKNDNVGVYRMGEVWVQTTGAAPTRADPVHYNATTGVFSTSGGSGPVRGARWRKTGANDLALLYLSGDPQAA